MNALYNERGAVYAWLHANGNIYGLTGEALAFVDGDGVYNWEGAHIAWWADGHVRDWLGAVCVFTRAATRTLVVKPNGELQQQRPLNLTTPRRPLKWPKMAQPPKLCIWTMKMPF
jgi:prepilin-type processing-associated H-X9-DG protein